MLKLLFGTLLAGLMSSCAIEESDSGTLTLDPNRGEAPEGVTIQDVDHVKDGVIDIKDLAAVAYFHGQTVDETEKVVAESCPAGKYRKPLKEVVGYNSSRIDGEGYGGQHYRIDASGRLTKNGIVLTDSSGRMLEDKYKESCDFLYPSGTNNSQCSVSCDHDWRLLCHQTKIESYTECKNCPSVILNEYKNYMPIIYHSYTESGDPTKCKIGEIVDKQYLFPHPVNINEFYTYTELRMHQISNKATSPDVNVYTDLVLGYGYNANTPVAVRFLISQDGEVSRLKELTVKIKSHNYSALPKSYFDSGIKSLSETFEFLPDEDYITYKIKGRLGTTVQVGQSHVDVSESATVYNDNINYTGPLEKVWGEGIQIGKPSKVDDTRTNYFIMKLQFRLAPSYHYFRWKAGKRGIIWRFPEEVRAEYFPEDIN